MTNAAQTMTNADHISTENVPEVSKAALDRKDEQFARHINCALTGLRRQTEQQSKTINRLLAMVEDLQERLNKAQKWAIKVNERIAAGQPDNAALVPAEDVLGN